MITNSEMKDKLKQLLPEGPAWNTEEGSNLDQLISAMAEEYTRVYNRSLELAKEINPLFAIETLEQRELEAGLPNSCSNLATTMVERKEFLINRWRARGGQSPTYFIQLAKSVGFTITIEEYRPFRAGMSRAGDPLTNEGWTFVWSVVAPADTAKNIMVAGQGRAGEPLRKWGNEMLECVINRYKPAHTLVLFKYV